MVHPVRALLAAMAASAGAGAAPAEIERVVVYVECRLDGDRVTRGSGVVVSPQGHVLTAGHVAPQGSDCAGSLGVADPGALDRMVTVPTLVPVDAALLRFSRPGEHEFLSPCRIEPWSVRREIYVAGFPGNTRTGAASFRQGVLSTTLPNDRGVLETDGQTIGGMSGGPVLTKDLRGLLGIVIGADFAADGSVSYYGILPAAAHAAAFGIAARDEPCHGRDRVVEPAAVPEGWTVDDGEVDLGVTARDGVCFVAGIWGEFNDGRDSVSVELRDGRFVLTGENWLGGRHGATARCVLHDP